jgi:hypothetical protein
VTLLLSLATRPSTVASGNFPIFQEILSKPVIPAHLCPFIPLIVQLSCSCMSHLTTPSRAAIRANVSADCLSSLNNLLHVIGNQQLHRIASQSTLLVEWLGILARYTFVLWDPEQFQEVLGVWDAAMEAIADDETVIAQSASGTASAVTSNFVSSLLSHALPSCTGSISSELLDADGDGWDNDGVIDELHMRLLAPATPTPTVGDSSDDVSPFIVLPDSMGLHIAHIIRTICKVCDAFPTTGVETVLAFSTPILNEYQSLHSEIMSNKVSVASLPPQAIHVLRNTCVIVRVLSCVAMSMSSDAQSLQTPSIPSPLVVLTGLINLSTIFAHNNQCRGVKWFDFAQAHILLAIKNFFPWLSDTIKANNLNRERVNEIVQEILQVALVCIVNGSEIVFQSSIGLFFSLASIVRPELLWNKLGTEISQVSSQVAASRPIDQQLSFALAISQVILFPPLVSKATAMSDGPNQLQNQMHRQTGFPPPPPPPASSSGPSLSTQAMSNQLDWTSRSQFLSALLNQHTTRYVSLSSTLPAPEQASGNQDSINFVRWVSRMLAELVRSVRYGDSKQKAVVWEVLMPTLPAAIGFANRFRNHQTFLEVINPCLFDKIIYQ